MGASQTSAAYLPDCSSIGAAAPPPAESAAAPAVPAAHAAAAAAGRPWAAAAAWPPCQQPPAPALPQPGLLRTGPLGGVAAWSGLRRGQQKAPQKAPQKAAQKVLPRLQKASLQQAGKEVQAGQGMGEVSGRARSAGSSCSRRWKGASQPVRAGTDSMQAQHASYAHPSQLPLHSPPAVDVARRGSRSLGGSDPTPPFSPADRGTPPTLTLAVGGAARAAAPAERAGYSAAPAERAGPACRGTVRAVPTERSAHSVTSCSASSVGRGMHWGCGGVGVVFVKVSDRPAPLSPAPPCLRVEVVDWWCLGV